MQGGALSLCALVKQPQRPLAALSKAVCMSESCWIAHMGRPPHFERELHTHLQLQPLCRLAQDRDPGGELDTMHAMTCSLAGGILSVTGGQPGLPRCRADCEEVGQSVRVLGQSFSNASCR